MDAPSAMTPTQLLLIWPLFALLVTWMILFLILALRPDEKKRVEIEERETHYRAAAPITTPPSMLRMKAVQAAQPHPVGAATPLSTGDA